VTRFAQKPTVEHDVQVPPGLEGLDKLAWLMDRAIQIPGTKITVGLDAILGLLPVGGDVLTGIIQTGIVLAALFHYKVPRAVAARMAANVLLDTTIGAIPLVGDAFDVFFKANTRNLKLLAKVQEQRLQHKPVATAPSILFLVALATGLIGVLALILIGFLAVVSWLFHRPLV
jgi:hypothetical protein